MVKENCIIPLIIKDADSDLRDLILKVWDFTQEELDSIRVIIDIRKRYEKAALTLHYKTNIETLTAMNIAAVASKNWNNNEASYFKNNISKIYTTEKIIWSEANLDVPYIHCLRESAGLYEGNLKEARKNWFNFQVSSQDLLRSIKIPKVIDYEVSQLLGIIWGDAFLEKQKQGYYICFHGNSSEWPFYEQQVVPMIKKHFNLPVEIEPVKNDLTYSPSLKISSEVIYTWLRDDIGFVEGEVINAVFPNLSPNNEIGFLEGLIAAKGSDEITKISFCDKDKEFIKSFKNLLAKYTSANEHYTVNCNTNSYRFVVSKNTLNGLQLINPKHQTP